MAQLGPYEVHPIAEKFPLMEGTEFEDLKQDIEQNGLLEPITTDASGEVLIDGRNRYRACMEIGVPAPIGSLAEDMSEEDIARFIISKNLKRRHLNAGQLAFLATEIEKQLAVMAQERKREAGKKYGAKHPKPDEELVADLPQPLTSSGRSRERAAEMTGVSERSIQHAKRIEQNAPDLVGQVQSGELSLHAAEKEVSRRLANNEDAGWEDPFKGSRAQHLKPYTHNLQKQNKAMETFLTRMEGVLQALLEIEQFRKDTPKEVLQGWYERINRPRRGSGSKNPTGLIPDLREVQKRIEQAIKDKETNA